MLKITQLFSSFVPNELLLTGGLTKFVWPRAAGGPSARNNEILRKLFETNHRNSLNYLRTTYGIRNKATLPPLSINLAYQDFIQELAEGLSYPTPYLLSARLSTAMSYQQLRSDRPEEDLETVLKTMAMSSEASMRIKGKTIETQPMVERLMETYRKFNEQTIAPPTTIEFLQR
jgi:hypothetical protein